MHKARRDSSLMKSTEIVHSNLFSSALANARGLGGAEIAGLDVRAREAVARKENPAWK
jgi:hypothetical protein